MYFDFLLEFQCIVFVLKIADRPTSNPLPPGTETLSKYQNVSSAQQILDSVAQEVPNFGTEQVIVVSLFISLLVKTLSCFSFFSSQCSG